MGRDRRATTGSRRGARPRPGGVPAGGARARPALEPLAVDEAPLWTGESAGPLQHFGRAMFRGDSSGVVDAATERVPGSVRLAGGDGAEPAWSLDRFANTIDAELPGHTVHRIVA